MQNDGRDDDREAIKAVIARQFRSLSWTPDRAAGWDTFVADFLTGATLYPAARPVRPRTIEAFVARMKNLAQTNLRSLEEVLLGLTIEIFGNIAVAVAGCEMTENDAEVNRSVEMMLLVKDQGAWRIAAQAWDMASDTKPFPGSLASAK